MLSGAEVEVNKPQQLQLATAGSLHGIGLLTQYMSAG
jgi:hypothetical protein